MSLRLAVIWKGLTGASLSFTRGAVRFQEDLERRLAQSGEAVARATKLAMHGERTRAEFIPSAAGGRRRRKQPRAVTAPPHVLGIFTGHLRKSITRSNVMRTGKTYSVEVGPSGTTYAPMHELGLRGMPKRPFLQPGIDATREQVFRLIGRSFEVV